MTPIVRFSPEWVMHQREEWRKEPIEADAIPTYRINYDIPCWYESRVCNPFGACLAVERLCCEVERLREVLERISDDADCTDLAEGKHLAREAIKQ